MKRTITSFWALALGVSLVAAPLMAQQQGGGRRGGFRAGVSILRLPSALEARLGLSADQKTKLQAIAERLRSEGGGRLAQGASQEERREAFAKQRAAREKAEAEAVALLTDAQKKQYEELRAEAESYAGLGGAGVALLSVSGLTAEQKSKLQNLSREAANRQQQPAGENREAAREARRAREEANRAAVKAILTAEQQKEFDAALEAARNRRGQN